MKENKKVQETRYEIAKEFARYFIYHLKQEASKPDKVIDYQTIEGISFREFNESMIKVLRKEFPDLKENTPSFNLVKQWWNSVKQYYTDTDSNLEYESLTFKNQNQFLFFKIMDIKLNSTLYREKFEEEMTLTVKKMREMGREVKYESIFNGEIHMFPLLYTILRRTNIPIYLASKILYEQNASFQKISYKIIDGELRESLQKTDEILKSILPEHIANEVKQKGKVKPIHFPSITVFFCDMAGFTEISSKLTPKLLLSELDACFSHFDKIIRMHGVEKIKTIGDSYMASSGLIPDGDHKLHAVNAVLGAIRIQEFMRKYIKSKDRKDLPAWRVRIGIHTGPVVAGILGSKRFNYDIWGDTVNIAQRMEASGKSDKINVSIETYEATKDFFDFHSRGKVNVKGKGRMEMFLVKGIKPELSLNKYGRTPNKKFKELYAQKSSLENEFRPNLEE
jgi:class 3 adenylate cyclase